MDRKVVYIAAHGGFSGQAVALGGGAAVCEGLLDEWRRTRPFEVELLSPGILGSGAPSARDLIAFSESRYARFCFDFRRAATAEVLRRDPSRIVVLANDVSEGPDFRGLSGAGFPIATIYHVDVVAYVTAIYLRSFIRPETAVRVYSWIRPIAPRLATLVFDQQEDSLRYSRAAIVPSSGMRATMLRCYPWLPPDRVKIVPWGVPDEIWTRNEIDAETERLKQEFGVPGDARVLLTLSRISPEKGQDALLQTLLEWERRDDYPEHPLWLFICGDAAYMQGHRYLKRLRLLSSRLSRTRVHFPGYVTGLRKRAFFALASLYVFPSRHESYGLTLLEALRAGLPAVCLDHDGARSVMRPEFGELVEPKELRPAISQLLSDAEALSRMSLMARSYAESQPFSASAASLADLLRNL